MAVTIRYKSTGKKEQVTRNVAFDLIDRGIAERVYEKEAKGVKQQPTGYVNRDLIETENPHEFKDKQPEENHHIYKNRRMSTK